MAFGTAPGQTLKDDWSDTDGAPVRYAPGLRDLVSYFFYHPKVKFGRSKPTDRERGALSQSIKRLRNTYTDDAIRRAIDKFYLTRTSRTHEHPAFAFCNREFQDKLFEGGEMVERQDDVLTFIASGCVRDESMDLPWDESADSDLRIMFIVDEELNELVSTYPDVVSELVVHWGTECEEILKAAYKQMQYVQGKLIAPSSRLDDMKVVSLPKDFLYRTNRPRKASRTLTEAVRISRGR